MAATGPNWRLRPYPGRDRLASFIRPPCRLIHDVGAWIYNDVRRPSTGAHIIRLSPSVFPELPANLVQELQRRQCTIPQETYSKKRNNVIKGEFARPGQTDWAVLCSVKGFSTILVFWNGSEKNPANLASGEDIGYVQFLGRDQWGYSRGIDAVAKDFIMRHYDAHGGPEPSTSGSLRFRASPMRMPETLSNPKRQ